MMNFLKDWIIQYQNKFSVGGVETTIDRITGTVSQEGDTISAAYLNEIQKNCIYQVNATRVIEGVLEIFDITIDGSEEFTPFDQTFLIDFSATNTKVDSLLRFNGNTYSLRFSDSILNEDIAPKIGFIPKRALVKLDVTNSKAIIVDFNPNNFVSPAFSGTPTAPTPNRTDSSTKIATTAFVQSQKASPAFSGTPTAPTPSAGDDSTKIATTEFVNDMLGGNTIPAILKSNNGYVKMANGLILQWGTQSDFSSGESQTVTFPVAFSNLCFGVQVTQSDNTDTDDQFSTYSKTNTTFVVRLSTAGANDGQTTADLFWFAIGY